MKVLWKGVYFWVIRGIIVAMNQPSFGSLFPVKRRKPLNENGYNINHEVLVGWDQFH